VADVGSLSDAIEYGYTASATSEPVGPRLLRITDIQDGVVNWNAVPYCRMEGSQKERFGLARGDIVFARTGATTGKSYLIRECPEDAVYASYLIRIRPNVAVYPIFLSFFFQTSEYWRLISENVAGNAQPNCNASKLARLPLLLPPLAEQKRIVAKVEALLAWVNAARERLAKVPALLKRFRQSVLAVACSGQLTADWRENQETTDSARLLLCVIGADEVTAPEEAVALPEPWTWASFGPLTVNHDGKRIPVKADDRAKRQGTYPYYGASGVIDSIDDFLFDGRYLLVAEDGANLLSRSTPIAFRASGRFWVNNHAHVVTTKGGMPLEYMEIFLNSLDLQRYVTGTAQPKLTQGALNGIPVSVPPLVEQAEIVRRVEALFALADKIEARVQAATARVEKITQAILAKAFRGELVPTEAELARQEGRDYEPASVLLGCIRAARAADEAKPKEAKTARRKRRNR